MSEKHWIYEGSWTPFKTADGATDAAKRYARRFDKEQVTIYAAVYAVKTPVPEYEVVTL